MLSKASKAILIQSTTAAIPFYTMQAVKMPETIIEKLDKLNGDFFWGHENGQRKLHTLAWKTICQPKEQGGLGFRRLRETKVAWRWRTESNFLWAEVLTSKYGSISKHWAVGGKKQSSYLCKGLWSRPRKFD